MKKLSALFLSVLILFNISACGNNQSTIDDDDNEQLIAEDKEKIVEEEIPNEPIEPKPDEDEIPKEPEDEIIIYSPNFITDSDGRRVFVDPLFFEPLSLLGYIITENGDVFIPTENWEECPPELFIEYAFGTWSFMGYASIIDSLYETIGTFKNHEIKEIYKNGDIIIFTVYEEDFSNMWIEWLDINNPNIMYGGKRIRDITDIGWDIEVNIYKDYIVTPIISRSQREIIED